MSPDPAINEYLDTTAGEGGKFNPINLNLYHYAGNNPLIFIDPTGLKQTKFQKWLTDMINKRIQKSERFAKFVKKHTKIKVKRNFYKGKIITDTWNNPQYSGTDTYYEDRLTVTFLGIKLNEIQVQSKVDHPSYPESNTIPDNTTRKAKIGESGATKPYIQDTLLIEGSKFLHESWQEGRKPGSGGCVVTENNSDEREVMDIIRKKLGFENGETIDFNFTKPFKFKSRKNLKKD